MKTLLAVIISVLLVSTFNAQSKPNTAIEQQLRLSVSNVTVHFDPNSKVTTLRAVAENFSDPDTKRVGAKAMNFAVGALYPGSGIDRSIDPLTFSFWVMSGKPKFGEDQRFAAVSGSERTELGSGRYVARRDGMEFLNFSLTRDQLSKLAAASTWVLGGKELTPTTSQKKLLHDVLAATQVD